MAGRQSGRHRRPAEAQATYREVFAVGEFRALWLAQALSFIGDQLAQVALAVLVFQRTGSALYTALTYALTYLPPIVGGPVLSGLADLFPRRTVMIMCDVARTVLVALMALRALPFWVLCVLVFLSVLLGAPFTAARAALLPDVLEGDRYVAGSAINNITHQATQMLGFVAGGAIVAMVGTYQALGLDALTFAASALILVVGLRRRPAPREHERASRSLWRGTRDGARLVFGDPVLRALVSFAWLCAFYVLPEGIAAPYAATFDRNPLTVGLLMSAMPTGMVFGAFVFSRFVRPTNRLRSMGWMAMLACAPLIVAGAHPPLWGVVTIYALSGVGSAYQLAANAAFVAAVPAEGRARAFGLAQSGILAGQGVGILVGGAAAQYLGPETVVALAGVLGLSVAAMLTLTWNQLRGSLISTSRERLGIREPREPSGVQQEAPAVHEPSVAHEPLNGSAGRAGHSVPEELAGSGARAVPEEASLAAAPVVCEGPEELVEREGPAQQAEAAAGSGAGPVAGEVTAGAEKPGGAEASASTELSASGEVAAGAEGVRGGETRAGGVRPGRAGGVRPSASPS
ncbi:MFS transporter [Actinomadura oligospora]|uniref:MFS transporter n=1 Tax=Actinomadura oligospora TaxID=111804 RepID=UPI0004B5D7B6|nr:MFS transporter [Actinomadura oligospora]